MPEPVSATGDSSNSRLKDPNPNPRPSTMEQRRWRARRRGEAVPVGAYYPALTKAGRPRKGTPRPVFELDQTAQEANGPGDQPGPQPHSPVSLNPLALAKEES